MQQCCQHNLNLCHGAARDKPPALSCDICKVLTGQAARLCIADVVVSLLVTRRKHNNLATSRQWHATWMSSIDSELNRASLLPPQVLASQGCSPGKGIPVVPEMSVWQQGW